MYLKSKPTRLSIIIIYLAITRRALSGTTCAPDNQHARKASTIPQDAQLVLLVSRRVVLVSRELRVHGEILFGAKFGAALVTRERMYAQMLLVNMRPDSGMPQDVAALPTKFDAVFVHAGRYVEGL